MKKIIKGDVRDFQGESLTRKKIYNERKKERTKRMRNMRKNIYI
jgi:hypothetical protein